LPLLVSSRVFPIVLAMAFALWAVRALGQHVLEPIPLLSLMATSICLRLVFEINVFGYYFMALAVMLLMVDMACSRVRGELVAWLVLVVLGFNRLHDSLRVEAILPALCIVVALGIILLDAAHGRVRRYLVAWLALVSVAFAKWPLGSLPLRSPDPTWLWQVVLVSTGILLAVSPLVAAVRRSRPGDSVAPGEDDAFAERQLASIR
jgi:hypothetical protein